LRHRRLRRHDHAVIMLRMLKIILSHDAIALRIGVARQLEIFLVDVMRVAADLDVGTVRIDRAVDVEVLGLATAAAATTTTAASPTAAAAAATTRIMVWLAAAPASA